MKCGKLGGEGIAGGGTTGPGGGAVGGGTGGDGGIIPTNCFTIAISCSSIASLVIICATVVFVPAMRTSVASNSPEHASLELFCITVMPSPKRSSGPNTNFGMAVSGQQASMQNEPPAVTVASIGGEGVATATKTK